MAKSKWTVMLIPHDNESVKSIHLSSSSVRAILSGLLVVTLIVATITTGFFMKQGQHLRAEQLERENGLLADEVTDIRSEMASLQASIDDLAEKDARYRTIAGLPAIDEDIRRVGIGGPGTAMSGSGLYEENPAVGEQIFAASYDLETMVRRANLLRTSMSEALATLERNTERLSATPSINPMTGGHLSSLFSKGRRHPVLRISRPHEGIDIAAPVGEPILAPANGRVIFAGTKPGGYGMTVELDHGFGYVTRFAHASRLHVRVGQMVEREDKIAEVGATGLVTGPHLHYEVEVNGNAVDPLNFIIADAIPD